MPPVLKPKPKTVQFILRCNSDLVAKIDAAASELGLNRTEAVIQFLEFAVEKHNEGDKRPKK